MPIYNFPGFSIKPFVPEPGVEAFEKIVEPISLKPELDALLNYKTAQDSHFGREFEIFQVKPGAKIVLPRSKSKVCSHVLFVGEEPDFMGLDKNSNLLAIMSSESIVRVEFGGVPKSRRSHVKYFKSY